MKKVILSAIATGMAVISLQAQTNSSPEDTIKTAPKPKATGAVLSETMLVALGSFEEPLTDTVKTKVKSDTIKTGSINGLNRTYAFVADTPQTDTIKTIPQTDTIKTQTIPKMTGSIQIEHTNAYVALLLSEIEEHTGKK